MDAAPLRGSQCARDALLIQGLAILFAAATASLAVFFGGYSQFQVLLGVGLAATVALACWSAVLAVRAVRGTDAPAWPALIVALVLVEASGAAIMFFTRAAEAIGSGCFWDWAFTHGLVVLVPILLLAGLLAVPVAWWRVRRAEKRAAASGVRMRGPLRRAVLWYVAAAALLVATLLPCPLFVFCAHAYCGYVNGPEWLVEDWRSNRRWYGWVVEHTPVPIGELSARLLSLSTNASFAELYGHVLWTGRVSKSRLVSEFTAPSACWSAMQGLRKADPAAAAELAVRIGNGEITGLGTTGDEAGQILGDCGTPEQIRSFLNTDAASRDSRFFRRLSMTIADRRPELMPDLERLSAVRPINPQIRYDLLCALAWGSSKDDTKRLWAGFFADGDYALRLDAMRTTNHIRPVNRRARVILPVLESDSDRLHFDPHTYFAIESLAGQASRLAPDVRPRLVKSLLRLLDQRLDARRHLDYRRSALWALACFTDAPPDLERTSHSLTELTMDGNPIRATPDDARVVKGLKEHAERWLQEKR